MELREILVREEPWKIPAQGKVCTAESFMDVPPLPLPFQAVGSLFEKLTPSLVPFIECCSEFLSRRSSERESDSTQIFSCIELRIASEFLRDRLELMELALLERNLRVPLLEQLPDTLPSINREGTEAESCRIKSVETSFVVFNLFTRDFPPVQIPSVGATDQYSISATEERCVHDKIHWLLFRDNFTRCSGVSIEVLAECLRIFAIPFLKILVGLSSCGVLIVGIRNPFQFLRVLTHKLTAANDASKLLSARLVSIFLDPK
jgi:hypothetical protein